MSTGPDSSERGVESSVTTPPARPITRTSATPVRDRLVGRTIGGCRLLKRIGRGGMGDVYLADYLEYHKTVAVKILPPDFTRNEELLGRFHREASSAGRLDHPNLVAIYDIGEENDYHFLVMEYVEGKNLQELLDEGGRLEPREAARIALEVARGLQVVHDEHIIHRDIKPGNILVSQDGKVKIVDFGLAFDAEDKTALTISGAVMGTPHFISPEQAEGNRADSRSDLYSLGICLYLMATGERPFAGESHMAVLYKQINEKPRDPRLVNPGIPNFLVKIIFRALEKRPERRYASADEFARELEQFVKGRVDTKTRLPKPGAAPAAARAGSGRGWNPLITFALAAWILVVGVSLLTAFFSSSEPEPPAPAEAAEAPAVAEPVMPAADPSGILSPEDLERLRQRDYAPVMRRLVELHAAAPTNEEKTAISLLGQKLSSAYRVVSGYRTAVARQENPVLQLRDGRVTNYAFTDLPAVHARSVVEYARKNREVSELDLAFFLLVDGEPLDALDHVLLGNEVRPEALPHFNGIVRAVLAHADPVEAASRLDPVRGRLDASTLARLNAARNR